MAGYDPTGTVDEAPAPLPPADDAAAAPWPPLPDPASTPQSPIRRAAAARPLGRSALRLGALVAVLLAAYAGLTVLVYGVSREAAFVRAEGSRLTVAPRHRDRPFDAPFERGFRVALADVPPVLVQAVLLREDRRFRSHPGVDPVGLARAVVHGGAAGGGSTITQQVAKLLFVGRARTPWRKLDEALVALWLEAILSKDEILELYLNAAYLGSGARGVEAAARTYFGLSFRRGRAEAGRLDALMAAQLAVALSSPGRFDPADASDADRVAALLALMKAEGAPVGKAPTTAAGVRRAIAARRAAAAAAMPVAGDHRDRSVAQAARVAPDAGAAYDAAPHLRLDHQLYLEREIARLRGDRALARDYPHALGYVIDLDDGGVTAQVGHAERVYPGSLVKPLVFLCARLRGVAPAAVVRDEPYGDPPAIGNRGRDYLGPIPLRAALAHSVNAPFARLLDELGEDCLREAATAAGAPMWLSAGGAHGRLGRRTMALGAAPVATAGLLDFYLSVASCGARTRHSHLAALWRPGRWAVGWRDAAPPTAGPEARAALADLQEALGAAATEGTAARLGAMFRGPVAAKTGTDDEGRQFGLAAFTGRWLVYLSFWTADPATVRRPRAGAALAPAMAQLLVNLHLDAPRAPLRCADAPREGPRLAAR